MRYLAPIFLAILLTAHTADGQTIPSSGVPAECDAIVAPSRADLEPWLAGSAWTDALRYYVKDQHAKADRAFREKWTRISGELNTAFGTPECNYDRVNTTLDARVFKAPPDVIPMEEDFGLPGPVAMAAADAACRVGDTAAAASWLAPGAASGDPAALAALVVLESASAPATAVSRVTRELAGKSVEVALAGCIASTRAGRPDAGWCARAGEVPDSRQGLRLQEILRDLVPAGNNHGGMTE